MGQAIKILLVEDQEVDAELIARALKRAGAVLETRRVDTQAGLRTQLQDFRPDIVLSDFTLPGFGGLEALEVVREHDAQLPFVFVSGTLGEDRAIDALKRGATDYVLKSSLGRLPSAVMRALDEAANHRARIAAEKEVRRNAGRLRDIVESSQDWIWELDLDTVFTFSNSAVQAILGLSPEAVLGRTFASLLDPVDHVHASRLLPDLARGEHAVRGRRARWVRVDGKLRWLESSATVALHGGQLVGYRGNLRDVTRQLEHEAHIARLNRVQVLLSSVNAAVARVHDEGGLLQEICRLAVERGGYARAIVALQDAPGAEPRPVAWNSSLTGGIETLPLPLGLRSGREEISLAATALRTGKPAHADDLEAREGAARVRHQGALRELGVRALAVLPLIAEPRPLGVLSLESREPTVFDAEELALLVQVAAEISRSLQHFAREERLHFLSWYDPLTQLARRELFCERLALLCGGAESSAAVVAVDVEGIGMVNDSLGRETGDELLRVVSSRLRTRLGNADRLAHLGGGTFAVALAGADAEGPGLVQARMQLREVFAETFNVGEREIDLQVRTGVARYPQDANTATDLVQNAETALRRAKATSLDDYEYTVTLNEQLARSMLIGQRLHRALAQSQFLLHYQPIVELETQTIVGAEALLRWRDPERGLVPPGDFIPLLEQSGQIVDVGQWVLEQVARDSRQLGRHRARRLHLAVNISPLQLCRDDFVERLLQVAMEVDGHDAQLEVEITESMLMQDLEDSIAKLADLRAAGIRVSIDDFGTGYSSLAMLARLPIDCLKIDRSFISPLTDDPASMTVVSTVIGLARSFRLNSVGEGVETDEQLKMLRLMKCDLGQGYLFGRPAPLAELLDLLGQPPQTAAR
jgi:diguanylate cyclase (GGDEF)-like protein/PAS domain S-box-containing protein